MIFNPRTTQRINEKTEEYRKRWIALKDSKADKNLIELAHDILEDLQNLNESYLILDSRQRDIMKLLDRDEIYFLTELLNTYAEHKEDEAAGYVSFKHINDSCINRTALLLFLALVKDDLSHEIFDYLIRKIHIGDIAYEGEK